MEGGIQRSDTVAPGWFIYGPQQPYLNTPDLNGATGILHCSPGWVWWGTPVASPDGGTWQNVWRIEVFAQTVYGLTIGKTYYFRYYYTSQGISTGPPAGPVVHPYPPDVTIIGATGYTNPSASKLFEWSTYSGSLVATADSMTIICSEGLYDGYIAYDGFYLGLNQPDNFLEVTPPDSVTLCGAGDASFSVQSAAGASYQWQSGLGGATWDNVSDGGGVSGSNTNVLLVPNVTATLNQMQYRCLVTSSCCNAVSAPALLLVVPPPKPALKINTDAPEICGSTSIIVSTDSFYHDYLWNDNSKNQNLQVTKPGVYWVEVTDSNNCIGKDSIQIYSCEKLVAPNAFTPNGDGINDLFKVHITGPVMNFKLAIYNRWGQMVFQSSDPGKGWDGTANGIPQPDDGYVWNCHFQLSKSKMEDKSGTVVLIR